MQVDNKKYVINFNPLQMLLVILAMLFLCLFKADAWLVLSVGIWLIMIFICIKNLNINIFFFFFLVSFFIFLMSGDIAELLFDRQYHLQFDYETNLHAHKSLFISLLFICIGFIFTKAKKVQTIDLLNDKNSESSTIVKTRAIAKYTYFIAFILIMFNTLDTIRFVASYGYIAYYMNFNPSLPTILVEVGELAPLALCLFLATFPSKKESLMVIISFLLYSFLTLFIGYRSGVILNTVFIISYCLYRNYKDKGKTVWISKKLIIAMIACIPFLLAFLFLYEYIRTDREIEFTSLGNAIIDFFVNIGSASQNIKNGYIYRDEIPKWRFYSLGGTLNYFKYGTLFNLFNLGSIPPRHSVEFALNSHSFDSILSYLTIPEQFLTGSGTGSSFIAELFADFGYVGIAIGSLIYGWIFKKMSYIESKNWLSTTIKMFIFLTMLRTPRDSYDCFISSILNIKHIFYIMLIYFLTKVKITFKSESKNSNNKN